MKRAFLFLLILYVACPVSAQKKELSEARSCIKSGKDLEKAEQLMTKLLEKDSTSRSNPKVYVTWFEAVRGQYEAANERLYLKQKQDTAAFFNLVRRMFSIMETLDSIEARALPKGKTIPADRQRHAAQLNPYRQNLFAGGSFFAKKEQWAKAYDFFEHYIDCPRLPLFGSEKANPKERHTTAAYMATYCAYRLHDAVRTLRHRDEAFADTAKAPYTLQFVAEARSWLGDEELYGRALEEGFERYPTFPYFFPRLVDLYTRRSRHELALATADKALLLNDTSQLYLFARLTSLYALKRYEEVVDVADRLIVNHPQVAEPYYYAGSACLNLALKLNPKSDRKAQRTLYQRSCAYMEKYRQLNPNDKDKWGPALYRIYLNLNMGRQFDEIDRLLKK